MNPRERFLADCAELWDETDSRPVFIFGQPGSDIALFAGPMTTQTVGEWVCFRFGHADAAELRQLDQLSLQDHGGAQCH